MRPVKPFSSHQNGREANTLRSRSGSICRRYAVALLSVAAVAFNHSFCFAATQPAPVQILSAPTTSTRLKHVLVVGQTKGYEHDSVSSALVTIYELGHETGLWDTTIRTDTELLTSKKLDRNARNLSYFDALVFASTTGELEMDASQRADMLAFIRDDGKGFVGIHAALDTNYTWPEYGEMLGGWFDEHPWMTFAAPIVNESPSFPAVRHLPGAFMKFDEIYQAKSWSRNRVNVLLSLDASRLDYVDNARIHRADHDFAVAWSKMYGRGRVFYSTLGHTEEAWQDPDVRRMYGEAIKWVLGLTQGDTRPHERPTEQHP